MTNKPQTVIVGGGVIGCAVAYELATRSVDEPVSYKHLTQPPIYSV